MLERFVKENFKNISLYYTGIILDNTEEPTQAVSILRLKIASTVVLTVVIIFTLYYFFILEVVKCQGN